MRAALSDLPLTLDEVSFRVGGVTILDHLSLSIELGSPTLIVGQNGAGKSSLLRLCMGLARPTGGTVTWGGRTASRPLRRAFLFQRPVMLRRSVAGSN